MKDLGQALLSKLDDVIDIWVKAVRVDVEIDSNKGLTYEAVHNGLPDVLESVATLLTTAFRDEETELKEDALEHGFVRAEQGFDLTEVVREYRVLRNVVVLVLEPELESGSVSDALKAVRHIDSVIDKVVLVSLQSYMDSRFSMLEQMHSQLLLTNQELIRLVQVQKDNVSHLAHELKNPLNSIISFSSLLLRKQKKQLLNLSNSESDAPLEMKQLERILDNGRQLLRLINNALEVSRADSAQMTITPEVVQVSSLVKTVVEALRPAVGNKDIELAMNCEQGPTRVTTDSLRLQQILTNLVSNAIRYTEAGNVTVASYVVAREDGLDRWALVVCDTGRGIDEEMRSKIFEPYVQAESDTLPESSGLGLTIVNKLVQLLHGEIKLESTLGQGSTFTVLLPMVLESSSSV